MRKATRHLIELTEKDKARFWKKVIKGQSEDDCWDWNACLHETGYGALGHKNKYLLAHRVSYLIHHGSIPEELFVLHRCDNRRCSNPKHLFLGTNQDNIDDRQAKGRQAKGPEHQKRCKACAARGERSSRGRLTADIVLTIRALYAHGKTISEIARDFELGTAHVYKLVSRKLWTHI